MYFFLIYINKEKEKIKLKKKKKLFYYSKINNKLYI